MSHTFPCPLPCHRAGFGAGRGGEGMVFLAAGVVGWGSVALTTMEPNDGAAINSSVEAPTPELPLLLSYCSLLFIPSHPHAAHSPVPIPGPGPPSLAPSAPLPPLPVFPPVLFPSLFPCPSLQWHLLTFSILLSLHMPLPPPFLLPAPAPPLPQSPFQSLHSHISARSFLLFVAIPPLSFPGLL